MIEDSVTPALSSYSRSMALNQGSYVKLPAERKDLVDGSDQEVAVVVMAILAAYKMEMEAFAHLLQAPHDYTKLIIREQFPVPRLVVCDQHGSQARFMLAKLDPSAAYNIAPAMGVRSSVIFTDDVGLQFLLIIFSDWLSKLHKDKKHLQLDFYSYRFSGNPLLLIICENQKFRAIISIQTLYSNSFFEMLERRSRILA